MPSTIKIINSLVAIKTDDENVLYFYRLPNFILLSQYEDQIGVMGIFNNKLFQFDYLNMKIHCYNENGDLTDKYEIEDYEEIQFDDWTCLLEIENVLIISPGSSFKFLVD